MLCFIEPQLTDPGGRQDNLQVRARCEQVIENRHPLKKCTAGCPDGHARGAIAKYIAVVQDGVIIEITDLHCKSGQKAQYPLISMNRKQADSGPLLFAVTAGLR